jgi:hypothetical protein
VANASCSTCTLVSNVLTLTGSVSGSLVVGMTVTGASVPPGVSITSFGTGSGGIGTYNCSASSANIPSVEPMVFSLSWNMPLQGNSGSPQLLDLGRAAGFGIIFASSMGGGTAGMGQEYQFGTHQAQLYDSQNRSGIFQSVTRKAGIPLANFVSTLPQYVDPPQPQIQHAATKTSEVSVFVPPLIWAEPQLYDFTLQSVFTIPQLAQSNAFTSEYQFGVHQAAMYDSQNRSGVFPAVPIYISPSVQVPLRSIHVQGQELGYDLTIQGWVKTVPTAQGWLLTMIQSGPQLFDWTMQATITPARPFQSAAPAAPNNPGFFFAQPQFDTTQIPARIIKPPALVAKIPNQVTIIAGPPNADQFTQQQIQPQIFYTSLPGPSKKIQPAFIATLEQIYDKNVYPLVFTYPVSVFVPPVIAPPSPVGPHRSVWTTDATKITADTINFTADGADLINGGGTPIDEKPGTSAQGGLAYNVSQYLRF